MKVRVAGLFLVVLAGFCLIRHFGPHPRYSRVFLTLGTEAAQRLEKERAERYLVRSLELNPQSALASHVLGSFYEQEGRWIPALRYLRRAVDLAPDQDRFSAGLGAFYLKIGDYPQAIERFQKALSVSVTDFQFETYSAGLALAYWKNGDRFAAVKALKTREHLSPAFNYLSQKTP